MNAKQRDNYVDCLRRIVELIGLVASNERVSHKVSKSRNAVLEVSKSVNCSDADYPKHQFSRTIDVRKKEYRDKFLLYLSLKRILHFYMFFKIFI